MNVRDPFNLHRSPAFNILRGTATRAASNVTQRVIEASTQAYESGKQAVEEMSFSVPKNVPSFSAPQRELENRVWGASGVTSRSGNSHSSSGVMNDMQARVGDFFERSRDDLPMYKDKPYSYASSRRQQPVWKRKRNIGIAALVVLLVFYFTGVFGGDSEGEDKPKETWSWDAYDRYAWGMFCQPA